MDAEIFAVLIPIVFFLCIAIILFRYIQYRNQERMAIIDKSDSVNELKLLFEHHRRPEAPADRYARWGIVLVSIGLAIVCGVLLEPYTSEGVIPGLIFLFPGIGLLLYYRVSKKSEQTPGQDS